VQTTNQAYKQAVVAGERQPVAEVRVDWLRSGNRAPARAAGIRINRAIISDLDPDVTLIAGHSIAQADVELTGDPTDNTVTAGALYSPYKAAGALADIDPEGLPVTVRLGVAAPGQDPLTVFVGTVRELDVDAGSDGTAGALQAFDGADGLTFAPVLPLVVAADKAGGVQPGLNSQFIADAVFRQGGYYASPPPGGGLASSRQMLSVPMHGSAWPDTLPTVLAPTTLLQAATASGGPIRFAPLRWGLGTKPDPVNGANGTMEYTLPSPQMTYTSGVYVEMWIRPSAVSYPLGDVTFKDDANAIGTRIRLGNNGANYVLRLADSVDVIGPAVTAPTAAHYLAVHAYISGGQLTAKWRVDGVTTTSAPIANPLSTGSGTYRLLVKTYNAIEALQVIDRSPYGLAGLEPPWVDAYVPNAVIEPGENDLVAMAPIAAKTSAWMILQNLAAAEAGIVLIDEAGVPQFWSREHWGTAPAATQVQRTLTATTALKGLTVARQGDRIRNVLRVPYTPVAVRPLSVLWAPTLSDLIIVPALGTATRSVDLSPAQVYRVDTLGGVIPSGGALAWGHSGYRAARYDPATGAFGVQAFITMLITPSAKTIDISWYNPNAWPVALVTPAIGYPAGSVGLPAAAVVGQLINADATAPDTGVATPAADNAVEVRWQPSIIRYGERPLDVANSEWRQTADSSTRLGQDLLHETAWPRPQLSRMTIAGHPDLQLGDRVQVRDDSSPSQTGIDEPAWIVGKTDRFSAGEAPLLEQDLVLKLVGRPRQLLLGVPGRSELAGPASRL
jgi:hypothetical protein